MIVLSAGVFFNGMSGVKKKKEGFWPSFKGEDYEKVKFK